MSNTQSLYELLKEQEQDAEVSDSGLCLEKWRELGENGASIPMKIPLHGRSMEPLIKSERELVTILPLVRDPLVGDIVLFRRADGKNIVHRVYRVFQDGIQTLGDNCRRPDEPISQKDIFGIIVSVEKKGKTYQLDTKQQRTNGIRWIKYGRPVWIEVQKIKAIGGTLIRKVYPDFHRSGKVS